MLSASFRVHLSKAVLLEDLYDLESPWVLTFRLEEFDVRLGLKLEKVSTEERYLSVKTINLSVSRDDPRPPSGSQKERTAYVEQRRAEFLRTATRGINAFVQFLQVEKRTKGLSKFAVEALGNPWWKFDGEVVSHGSFHFGPLDFQLISEFVTPDDIPRLGAYLPSPPSLPLADELLIEAWNALSEYNLRKAVVEAAMAAEIGLKTALHEASGTSYAEDQFHDLFHTTTFAILGRTLGHDNSNASKAVNCLMECRNKAVHEGRLVFSGGKATHQDATSERVAAWLHAVRAMLDWLQTRLAVKRAATASPQGLASQ